MQNEPSSTQSFQKFSCTLGSCERWQEISIFAPSRGSIAGKPSALRSRQAWTCRFPRARISVRGGLPSVSGWCLRMGNKWMGVPQIGWFIKEILLKWMITRSTPISGKLLI
jgi:hypothetical protein